MRWRYCSVPDQWRPEEEPWLQPVLSPHRPRICVPPALCALRPQGAGLAAGFVPPTLYLAVGSEGPEPWCPGPSVCPEQPQVIAGLLCPDAPQATPSPDRAQAQAQAQAGSLEPWWLRPPAQNAADSGSGPSSARKARRAEASQSRQRAHFIQRQRPSGDPVCARLWGCCKQGAGPGPRAGPWAAGSCLVGQAGAGLRASSHQPPPDPSAARTFRDPFTLQEGQGTACAPYCRRLRAKRSVAAPKACVPHPPPLPPQRAPRSKEGQGGLELAHHPTASRGLSGQQGHMEALTSQPSLP